MSRTDHRKDGCDDRCDELIVERNRYFNGKFMTARDFAAEQDYLLSRHRLQNRLFHGSGVVCGYEITRHPDEKNCPDRLCVGPGIAVDCCGRELVLAAPVVEVVPAVDSGRKVEGRQREAGDGQDDESDGSTEPPSRYLLCATYVEHEVEFVPVIGDDCRCDSTEEQANRIREAVELSWKLFDPDEHAGCWRIPGGGKGPQREMVRNDCADPVPGPGRGCLEPHCPCGVCVALALVTIDEHGKIHVDTTGRDQLPPPPEYLTHIVRTNWVHGQTMTMSEFRDLGRLEICFDRDLAEADGLATGIGPETLVVQHAGEAEAVEFVPFDPRHPPHVVDGNVAVYRLDENFLARNRQSLIGSTIFVTLRGDFVLDCHGLAVDADHIGGRLASGNGLPGGTFLSWFRIGTGQRPYEAESNEEEEEEL